MERSRFSIKSGLTSPFTPEGNATQSYSISNISTRLLNLNPLFVSENEPFPIEWGNSQVVILCRNPIPKASAKIPFPQIICSSLFSNSEQLAHSFAQSGQTVEATAFSELDWGLNW